MNSINKKTILFILPFMPYPLESGGHQALFNGIKAVKDEYNVLVTYPAINNDEYHKNESSFVKALPGITVLPMLSEEVHLSFFQRIYKSIKTSVKRILGIKEVPYIPNIYDGWIPTVSPLKSTWWNHLKSIFDNYDINVAQVEMPRMIGAVYNIPAGIKKVYVHHELAFVRHEQEMQQLGVSDISQAYADYTKMIEINLLNKYDSVITLSQTDKDKLLASGVSVPLYSSFAVVDTSEYHSPDVIDNVLSFVGPDRHTPNYEGVIWFLNNCWDKLKSLDDSYRLQIIGQWSEASMAYISSHFKDVSFLGYVDDLGKVIQGTIMIVPITIGSGIRMKILEAASRGVPVVSTSIGAEGLLVQNGVQCFIKDNADDFVSGIQAFKDLNIAKSMCDAAYRMVSERYSFGTLRKDRLAVMQDIICQ